MTTNLLLTRGFVLRSSVHASSSSLLGSCVALLFDSVVSRRLAGLLYVGAGVAVYDCCAEGGVAPEVSLFLFLFRGGVTTPVIEVSRAPEIGKWSRSSLFVP